MDVASNNIFDPGDTIKYTVILQNTGTQIATNPLFTDTLDPQTTLVVGSVVTSQGTVTTGNTLGDISISINLGAALNVGETVTITFDALIPATLSGNIDLLNQGLFTFSNQSDVLTDDPDTLDPNDITKTFVVGEHDLVVTKSDGVTTVQPGDTLTYTINVTNNGNVTVNNIALEDILPPVTDAAFISADNGGVLDTILNKVTWANFSLTSGASRTVTVVLQVNNPLDAGVASISNTVNVSDDGSSGPDLNLANNTVTDTDTVAGSAAGTDLLVTKTDGLTKASYGDNLNYSISITNVGTRGASGVVVTDPLPSALSFVSASNGGTFSSGNVVWNIPVIAVGQTINLNLVAKKVNYAIITNNVSITDDGTNGPDLNPLNN